MIPNDPKLKKEAEEIARKFGEANPELKGDVLAWHIEPDDSLTVILVTGPQINASRPKTTTEIKETMTGEINMQDGVDRAEARLAGKALRQSRKT